MLLIFSILSLLRILLHVIIFKAYLLYNILTLRRSTYPCSICLFFKIFTLESLLRHAYILLFLRLLFIIDLLVLLSQPVFKVLIHHSSGTLFCPRSFIVRIPHWSDCE